MENESGRSLTEILGVLAIVGILSVCGLAGYVHITRQRNVDMILDTLQQKIIEIHSAQATQQITDPDEFDEFLESFTTTVGNYELSFYATDAESGAFISEVTHKDGSKLKGAFCRKLITKMAEQQYAENVYFSLLDEPLEDGTTKDMEFFLHGKTVSLDDICGE